MLFLVIVVLIFELLNPTTSLLFEEVFETAQLWSRFQNLREEEKKATEKLAGLGLCNLGLRMSPQMPKKMLIY